MEMPLKYLVRTVTAVLLVFLFACDGKKVETKATPTFSALYNQRLSLDCVECHTGSANANAGGAELDFTTAATAYDTIVNGIAVGVSIQGKCVDVPLIQRNNASQSYFVAVFDAGLNQTGFADQANCTPDPTHITTTGFQLTADEMSNLIDWINSGAPNN